MTIKSKKTFDCVEMKNRIQAEIQAECESRRNEFPSFVEFIKAAAAESDYVRAIHDKFGAVKEGAKSLFTLPRGNS